jgi:hypothetical protein
MGTFAAAANRGSFARGARINDLIFLTAALGTTHKTTANCGLPPCTTQSFVVSSKVIQANHCVVKSYSRGKRLPSGEFSDYFGGSRLQKFSAQTSVFNFMATANDLRRGMAINYNGDITVVLDMQHRTPGNLRAFVQATLRSIRTGKSSDVRFSSTERIEPVPMITKKMEFSYKDGDGLCFHRPGKLRDGHARGGTGRATRKIISWKTPR